MVDIRPQDIVTTGGTQSRVALSEETVATYAEAMKSGATLPPIVVYHDGSTYWLADGFHRLMAHIRNGAEWLTADVRIGTRREAVLHSVGANDTHGLRRSNADKRNSVLMLLKDEEWGAWADREIARRCCVQHQLVGHVRASLGDSSSDRLRLVDGNARRVVDEAIAAEKSRTYTNKHGTTSTMNTENIGKRDTGLTMGNGRRLVVHSGNMTQEERAAVIRDMAEKGNRAEQIADALDVGVEWVRKIAGNHGIKLDVGVTKQRRINNRRVVEQTVLSLEASAQSLVTVGYSADDITPEEAAEWAEIVGESLRVYRAFHKALSEVANGK